MSSIESIAGIFLLKSQKRSPKIDLKKPKRHRKRLAKKGREKFTFGSMGLEIIFFKIILHRRGGPKAGTNQTRGEELWIPILGTPCICNIILKKIITKP